MLGRVFKEKQLRLCVVAALTSLSAPVAESLLLPPRPLASNLVWQCDSGLAQKRFCNQPMDQNHKLAKNIQKKPLISTLVSSKLVLHQPNYSQKINQPVFSEVDDNTRYSNSLLTLSGDQYVLQWMAAKERGQLEALKQRYPVLKNALIAQYKRSGHIWFVLIDGPFKNRADAMAELGTPPRSAMASELYPWARSLASIQRLNPVISDPSYRVANNDYHNPVDALASGSTPLLVTTDQNVPYFNQPYMGPNSYNAKVYPSQRVRVATKRQGYSDRPTTNQQQNNKHHTTLPYGTEFEENTSLINQNDKSIIIYQESPTVSGTYNNTASVYDNNYTEQQFDQNIDYNQQNGGQRPHKHVVPAKSAKPFKTTAPITQRQYSTNVLTANPKSYTIQWMSSSRKASLKRAQLRYGELQNTQIIRYTRKNRQRYLLVSMLFVNRSDAMHALLKPSLARVSTRFSPKIRQVSDVQTLVSNTSQSHHARVGSALEPELYKRQWLGTDDPGDQKYITHRRIEYQQSHTIANNGYGALPATVRAPESNRASVITPHKEQLNALLNTRSDAYTIQWFSSHSLKSIEQLKQRFPQLRNAMTVQIQKDNRQWFVLVQGQYRNSQEAIRALKMPSMKMIAMVLHPWTRPINSLKKLSIAAL